MPVRVVVRGTKRPGVDYIFEASEQPHSWNIRHLKYELITKYIPSGDPDRIRIIHTGRILQNDVRLSEVIEISECQENLVLHFINLDDINTKPEPDPYTNKMATVSRRSDKLLEEQHQQQERPAPPVANGGSMVDHSVQTDSKCQQPDPSCLYANYIHALNRWTAESQNAALKPSGLPFDSAFCSSYAQEVARRCMQTTARPPAAPVNENTGPVEQPPPVEPPYNPVMEFLVQQLRQYNTMSNFFLFVKLSAVLVLLYAYDGLSRLLMLLFVVALLYLTQHFRLAARWANRTRAPPPGGEQPPGEQQRYSYLRIIANFVISLLVSVVPTEDDHLLVQN